MKTMWIGAVVAAAMTATPALALPTPPPTGGGAAAGVVQVFDGRGAEGQNRSGAWTKTYPKFYAPPGRNITRHLDRYAVQPGNYGRDWRRDRRHDRYDRHRRDRYDHRRRVDRRCRGMNGNAPFGGIIGGLAGCR